MAGHFGSLLPFRCSRTQSRRPLAVNVLNLRAERSANPIIRSTEKRAKASVELVHRRPRLISS